MNRYIPSRKVGDVDAFVNHAESGVDGFWHPSLLEWWKPGEIRYATLDELYTIKVSHSYWELKNGSWDKHIADIITMQKADAKLIQPLHDLLYKVWEEEHGKKRVNLQMDKEAFFADAVKRVYDHDSIHVSVAYGERPLYEAVLHAEPSVAMDMGKVKALPVSDSLRLFREEIYATALERWVIPSGYKCSPGLAYKRALRKTITSLTKGWSAQFLVEHIQELTQPDTDYIARHKSRRHLLIPLEEPHVAHA